LQNQVFGPCIAASISPVAALQLFERSLLERKPTLQVALYA
jgi:hypothetical protein